MITDVHKCSNFPFTNVFIPIVCRLQFYFDCIALPSGNHSVDVQSLPRRLTSPRQVPALVRVAHQYWDRVDGKTLVRVAHKYWDRVDGKTLVRAAH